MWVYVLIVEFIDGKGGIVGDIVFLNVIFIMISGFEGGIKYCFFVIVVDVLG